MCISQFVAEFFLFLPPASEGWGKVLFSVCLSVHTSWGGYPISGLGRGGGVSHPRSGQGGVPHPRSGRGGTPSQVWPGGYPLGQGTPQDLGWGTPPGHWTGYSPDLGWGTPLDLGRGTPWTWDGVPPGTWDGVPPPG